MKKREELKFYSSLLLMFAVLLSLNGGAQDLRHDKPTTLMRNNKIKGAYVGMSVQGYDINGEYGYGLGGEVALVMGRRFNFGLSGQALATDVVSNYQDAQGNKYFYEMAYGGLFIEPMIRSKWPIHLSFPVTLGGGAITESKNRVYNWDVDYDQQTSDYYLVAQTGANLEFNVFRFMRIAGGVNYRFMSDVYLHEGTSNMSGFGGNVTLKLGWF